MTQSLLKLFSLVPHFSTVSRCPKYLSVNIAAQPTTTGLHPLIDSTGIKMLGESEWKTKKHGPTTVASGARSTLALTRTRWNPGH